VGRPWRITFCVHIALEGPRTDSSADPTVWSSSLEVRFTG
jgi:hypothetical protein